MKKIKIIDKNGKEALYFNDGEMLDRIHLMGFGTPDEYTVEVIDITQEHKLQKCIENRKSEYPTVEEFLNAYFDGGESAVNELQAKRLAIKAKYPKP